MVDIIKLDEDGQSSFSARYSSKNPKQSLINYLEQFLNNNFNTWEYDLNNKDFNSKFLDKIKTYGNKKTEWVYHLDTGLSIFTITY